MKLSYGNANCLFALLSRATQVAKSKSACPDFIYRHDICAIYIFEGVEVLIALSVNRNSLRNCRQFVAKNNRTNTPNFSIVFVVLCASMCVAKVSITIALDCLDNCAICRMLMLGGSKASVINFQNVKTIKARNKFSTWQHRNESLQSAGEERGGRGERGLFNMSFDY